MKLMSNKNISLGINIGSQNTVYSLCYSSNGKFTTEVLLSDVASRTIPSQICYSDTNRLYGETSNSKMKRFYNSSYLNISRLIGFFLTNSETYKSMYKEEFKYIENECFNEQLNKFKIYNNEYCDSYIIIADYLSLINKYYFEENEIKYDYTTFSIPDYYTYYQKNILKIIAEGIGMKNVNIINESTAITIYYGYNKYNDMFKNKKDPKDVKHIIFVDIGHSKTSFIYSTFTYNSFKVEYVKSSYKFGGRNIDKRIFNLSIDNFKKENSISNEDQEFTSFIKRNKKYILDAVIKARKVLTVNEDSTVLIEDFYKSKDLKYELTRESFQNIIKDYTDYVNNEFKEFLTKIPQKIINIAKIEMAGELMRIPIFQEIIKSCNHNFLISKTILIDECCSVGAGLYTYYYKYKNYFPIKELNQLIIYEPIIHCNLYYGGDIEKFIFQNNNSIEMNQYQMNVDDIISLSEIKVNFIYENNLYPSKYETIYSYKIDVNKLKNENPDLNNMSNIKFKFIKENDEIKINLSMIDKNSKEHSCKYSNGFELDNMGIINNEWDNIKNEITQTISNHTNLDKKYHIFVNIKNGLIRLINKKKDKKEITEEQAKNYKNLIKQLSEDTKKNIEVKIKEIKNLKKEIEDIIKNKFKDEEIKFEGEKKSLIEKIKLAREMNKIDIKTGNEIVKRAIIFQLYCEKKLRQTMMPSTKIDNRNSFKNTQWEDELSRSLNFDNNKTPFEKKKSNLSIESEYDFEKIVGKDEEEDNKFFEEIINEIKNIPISEREKLKKYETDWVKIIDEKKYESKKNDVLKKIDIFMEMEDYENVLKKIKEQLENNEITPDDANFKILALKKIDELNYNPFK